MPLTAPRLPGLRFETVRPPAPPDLPRMDVAAFVGFASTGPVGVPVAVDDEVRFGEVFGRDLPLAWDRARGETVYAHLAPAVREFFRNGGRRCWIVRVADEATLEAAAFRVPGMLHAAGRLPDAAYLLAASPGSWADRTALSATLQAAIVSGYGIEAGGVRLPVESAELLRLEWPGDGAVAFFPPHPGAPPRDATREEREAEKVRPVARSFWFGAVDPGTLAAFGGDPVFLSGPREVPLATASWALAADDATAVEIPLDADVPGLQPGCWIRARVEDGQGGDWDAGDGGGPTLLGRRAYLLVDDVLRSGGAPVAVVRQAWRGLHPETAWEAFSGSPAQASLVSVELWTRRGDGTVVRLPDLGLAPGHPRFLGTLPPDQVRFAPVEEISRAPANPLHTELALRRFPLAAPDGEVFTVSEDGAVRLAGRGGPPGEPAAAGPGTYLPLGVPTTLRDDFYQAAHTSGRLPLERDGLGAYAADLFLDPLLQDESAATLVDTAFHNRYVAEPPLPPVRLHALLPVEEVSLLCVPDAVHTGWELREAEVPPPAPPAPTIVLPIPRPDAEGRIAVRWTEVAGARGYTLQDSPDPRFRRGVGATEVPADDDGVPPARAAVVRPFPCPARLYFRVRARTAAGTSAWSETALLDFPEDAFGVCGDRPLGAPALSLSEEGERLELTWTPAPGDEEVPPGRERVFRVEQSSEPAFGLPELVYEGSETSAQVWKPLSGALYFRAAARLQEERYPDDPRPAVVLEESPWSAVRAYAATQPRRWEARSPAEVGAPPARDLHLAMLRFCAARSDCLAVLALPRHYREADALAHAAELTARLGGVAEPGDAGARTLSFGAVYHPWTVVRTPVAAAPLRAIPPDGATCGVMAARAVSPGAWAAPANQPLAGVAALDPKLAAGARTRFLGKKVNAVAPFPRGFMTWSEETLSDDPELRGVGVRRLLILLRRLALREGNTYVFEPHSPVFRRKVQRQFDALLGGMFVRGAFAGASHAEGYRVVTDDTVNPPTSVEQGRFVVELRVAPSRPMAFLTVRLVQGGAGLAVQEG